jgi:hypothetical protein
VAGGQQLNQPRKRGSIMERCSPVEMRKNLQVVEQFKKNGIDFVAIPVRDAFHKNELIAQGNEVLESLVKSAES